MQANVGDDFVTPILKGLTYHSEVADDPLISSISPSNAGLMLAYSLRRLPSINSPAAVGRVIIRSIITSLDFSFSIMI